jgi:hypothetical protein
MVEGDPVVGFIDMMEAADTLHPILLAVHDLLDERIGGQTGDCIQKVLTACASMSGLFRPTWTRWHRSPHDHSELCEFGKVSPCRRNHAPANEKRQAAQMGSFPSSNPNPHSSFLRQYFIRSFKGQIISYECEHRP